MGSKTSKVDANTFTESELQSIRNLYNKYKSNNGLDLTKFLNDIFFGMNLKIIDFLNSMYTEKKLAKIANISLDDFVYLAYVLTKINQASNDNFNFSYYRKYTVQILYDIIQGKFGMCEEKLNLDNLGEIFSFAVEIFNSLQKTKLPFEKKLFEKNLKQNLPSLEGSSGLTFPMIRDFLDNLWYNLEPYIKLYFDHVFLKDLNSLQFKFSLPVYTANSNFLSIDQYFTFLMLNPHVYNSPYAFKLFDCSKQGFNIPELIYSFLGFGGPVGIFIEHLEVSTKQQYVLGVFINSNFKDCYENFCGDDLTFLFSISPKLEVYKYSGSCKNICFLCRRAQNFSKMVPGIGNSLFTQESALIRTDTNFG
jgi:hypothetical protein